MHLLTIKSWYKTRVLYHVKRKVLIYIEFAAKQKSYFMLEYKGLETFCILFIYLIYTRYASNYQEYSSPLFYRRE